MKAKRKGVMVFADRYSALGPSNGCKGPCEGTGWVPVRAGARGELLARWRTAHDTRCTGGTNCDGWHFVPCPECRP
jgi:hypothetical protein